MRAILFDMDGVLVDSLEAWWHLLRQASRDLGGREVTRDAFLAGWGQGIEADIESFFHGRTAEEVGRYYEEHFGEHAEHVAVTPQAPEVVAALRRRGMGTGVVTNTPSALARRILAPAGIEPDVLVGGLDVPNPKPAPDIVLRACELLQVPTGAALLVGDSEYDREAAAGAGVRFAGYGGIAGDVQLDSLLQVLDLL